MQLTAREMKMVARLRKAERLWPRWRWGVLGAGVFAWAVYGYIAFSIANRLQSEKLIKDPALFKRYLQYNELDASIGLIADDLAAASR